METQKPKMKTSTVIIGLIAVAVIVLVLVFVLMFAGGGASDAADTTSDPNAPAVLDVPTAPSDHGHTH